MLNKFNIRILYYFCFIVCIGCTNNASQSIEPKIEEDVYSQMAIDKERNLIIVPINDDEETVSLSFDHHINENTTIYISEQSVRKREYCQIADVDKKKKIIIEENKVEEEYDLFFSNLPVVTISTTDEIVDDPKVRCEIRLMHHKKSRSFDVNGAIEIRGNTSQSFPKKSYAISFDKKIDVLKMGKENDWILNASFIDKSFMRNHVSMKVAQKLYPKQTHNRKFKAAIDGKYVELFVNGDYRGLYMLSERVDRKFLALDKNEGVIYKAVRHNANFYEEDFNNKPNPKKNWHQGFEIKYPKNLDKWEPLDELVKFVATSPNEEFINNIAEKIDIDNAVNHYLLILFTHSTDCLTKNYFIARNKKSDKFFFTPWDFDSTYGLKFTGAHGEYRFMENNLFERLIELNVDGFNEKIRSRWKYFKKNCIGYMKGNFKKYAKKIEKFGAVNRNFQRWNLDMYHPEHEIYYNMYGHSNVNLSPLASTYDYYDDLVFIDEWLEKRTNTMEQIINDICK